jgi:hypothetical protein
MGMILKIPQSVCTKKWRSSKKELNKTLGDYKVILSSTVLVTTKAVSSACRLRGAPGKYSRGHGQVIR